MSSLARRYGFDLLIVIGAIEATLEAAVWDDVTTDEWFAVPMTAAVVLTLLARRRFPFAAPAATWLLAAAITFIDGRLTVDNFAVFAAGMAAALLLGNLPDAAQGRAGLAITVGAAGVVVYNDPGHTAGAYLFVPVLFAIAWLAGYTLRERTVQAEHAVFEERVRIARELHDVVAHHVSTMGVQAGAARLVIDRDPDQAKTALAAIEASSRQAVAELHRLLGFLRQEGDRDELAPQPGLEQLTQLTESLPLTVAISVDGAPRALPPTVDVSAYRIVQEALTNTLKHANASRADVHVRYAADAVELEIVDDGRAGNGSSRSGLGLIGMRERTALHGGQLSAGPGAAGGFVVKATLPT
ncbi:sensor histidine kinase [Solirubrobacter taibaiensis]|nr:sensor histidine kinase [Solirubrobacter taibaiensis]